MIDMYIPTPPKLAPPLHIIIKMEPISTIITK